MGAIDIIRRKRDGEGLDEAAVREFVAGATDGSWPDYQLTALLMAIRLRGMGDEETAWLTDAMARSGEQLDFHGLGGPVLDKHSTGGVGDKISLILAPLVAACGGVVPMMSGRGLGHTGGTIDKLESIPGFRTNLDVHSMRRVLARANCCITAPTTAVAPADRCLYRLRDVTATVDSIPLITGSILSKKLAEGLDALVLDVKVGKGAFMTTEADARALAGSLVDVGRRTGLRIEALLTAMDAPLGRAVGNSLEVTEAIDTLKGSGPADLTQLSIALGARMLVLGGLAADAAQGRARLEAMLASGTALDHFERMVEAQGGDPRVIDHPEVLDRASDGHVVTATRDGILRGLDAARVGVAAMALGAGRARAEDPIDPGVGVTVHVVPGASVRRGEPIVTLWHRKERGLQTALSSVLEGMDIGDTPTAMRPLILGEVR